MSRFSLRDTLRFGALSLGLFFSIHQSAQAFYWPNWPASGMDGTSTTSQSSIVAASSSVQRIATAGEPVEMVIETPEPSTLAAGLIGLIALRLVGRVRKK